MLTPIAGQLGPLATRTRPYASASFDPASISGLRLYLDARDASSVVLTAGAVSQWSDKSGLAHHAIQTSAPNRPLYKAAGFGGINGLGSLYTGTLDGTSMGFLNFASNPLAGATEATLFMVTSNDTDGGIAQGGPIEEWGTSGSFSHQSFYSAIYNDFGSTTRQGPFAYTAGTLAAPNAYTIVSSSSEWSFAQGTNTLFTTPFNAVATQTGTIGSSFSAAPWVGRIAIMLAYARSLTTGERSQLHTFASSIWGTP